MQALSWWNRSGLRGFCGVLLLTAGTAAGRPLTAAEPAAPAAPTRAWVEQHLDELVGIYRDFHSHPELSFQEQETSRKLAQHWQAAGAEVTTGLGRTGVVGLLKNGDGPTLLLRTDLDALPVTEQTGLIYASRVKVKQPDGVEVGVMHACGHDVHITSLIGTARYLNAHRDAWKGTVMLIGQPAEEIGSGAKAMLDDQLFTRFPKPDFGIALHVDASLAAGKVGYRPGYALANTDSVDIVVHGKGGHGAYPHMTIDPIVQAAQLILALQTLVSREVQPTEPAVVTVGSIHAGTKHNIIPNECRLQLTVRSYTDDVRAQLLDGIRRKAKAVALSVQAEEPTITVSEGTPALRNDEALTARIKPVLERVVGEKNVTLSEPSMGGEDFSQYGRAGVPIVMYRLGSVEARRLARFAELGQDAPSLHSPLYYPDIETTLTTGVSTMSAIALELLPPRS